LDAVARVEPVYEELSGWCRPTSGVQRYCDLPANARAYIERIGSLVGVPVSFVSVGTRRDQLIRVE
jgi:adenylosuccinate synthase